MVLLDMENKKRGSKCQNNDIAKFNISWKGIVILLALTGAALYYIFTKLVNPLEMIDILRDYPLSFYFWQYFPCS